MSETERLIQERASLGDSPHEIRLQLEARANRLERENAALRKTSFARVTNEQLCAAVNAWFGDDDDEPPEPDFIARMAAAFKAAALTEKP